MWTLLSIVKYEWKIIFVAFSENLNFNNFLFSDIQEYFYLAKFD